MNKNYHIVTLGCQMNDHDSEAIAAILEKMGYLPVTEPEEADIIIINTCAVRKKPEDKVASLLGKYAALKEYNQNLFVAVGGCMPQQEESAIYLKNRFHHVNLIFGTHALPRLPELIHTAKEKNETVIDIKEDYAERDSLSVIRKSTFKAWLPIIYGCNNYCSYCVVPYVRGRERSRPMEVILAEAEKLAAEGYLEITLLGQNVNSYGQDLQNQKTFADLLFALNYIEGIERIRFMTSHPKDLSQKLIAVVQEGKKVCEHFHLPVQSGSNRILEKMNRRYTREQYLDLVKNIKETIPGVAITSDIIVGFPGEEEEDFQATLDLLERAYFDNVFSFKYSGRKNTAAAGFKDFTTNKVKEQRLERVNKIQQVISKDLNKLLFGQAVEIMVEGPSKNNREILTGRTRTNKLVHFKSHKDLTGKLIMVKITEARTWNLFGELV